MFSIFYNTDASRVIRNDFTIVTEFTFFSLQIEMCQRQNVEFAFLDLLLTLTVGQWSLCILNNKIRWHSKTVKKLNYSTEQCKSVDQLIGDKYDRLIYC